MTFAQLLNLATKPAGPRPLSNLDAELLLAFVLNIDRPALLAHLNEEINEAHRQRFDALAVRRLAGIPLAYLVGEKEFYGRSFVVSPDVLIPRPETELLVEEALGLIDRDRLNTVADIGCGSGIIALTINAQRPKTTVFASDCSLAALKVAQTNQRRLGTRVAFFDGDLLEPLIAQRLAPELIVANLPYLNPDHAQDSSISAEPALALFSKNGHSHQCRLLNQISRLFQPPLAILLETDPRNLNTDLHCAGYAATVKKDLAGLDRMIVFLKT